FQEVGVHDITVWTYYSDCVNQGHTTIEFPKFYEPILKYAVTCNGNNNYNVTLYNNSNLFKINQSDVTFTYSGPGITGTPTGQNYTVNNLAPGTYTYYLTLTTTKTLASLGYTDPIHSGVTIPPCTIPVTFTLEPTPDLNFDLLPSYCAEEPINLVVTNYNSAYKYSWWYNFTHIKDDGDNATQINVPYGPSVAITLKAEMRNGCIYESAAKLTTIKKAEFFGSISPNPIDACEGNIPALSFSPNLGTLSPTSVFWMKDDQQVATTT